MQKPGVGSHLPFTQKPHPQAESRVQDRCTQPCTFASLAAGLQSHPAGQE